MIFHPSLLLLFLLPLTLHAQEDGPIQMTPPFALAFPVVQMNKHDVSVKFPVLINPVTVLKPGMILRVIYLPPAGTDTDSLGIAHHGDMEQAYSRQSSSDDAGGPHMDPTVAHAIETERRHIWEVPNNFILAIAQYPTDTMHLIYSKGSISTGFLVKEADIQDTSFSFFDGMFVGAPDGTVKVLAVEKDSRSDQAGVKAGDQIVSVGGTPLTGDLSQFASAHSAAKRVAKDYQASTYAMVVRSAGGADRTVQVPMPPTIKSMLMNGS